jgi:small-conductance mechanosensitive channel
METVLQNKRKTGIIAGAICFLVLYSPLLFATINRAQADWQEYFGSWLGFTTVLLGNTIIPILLSVFWGNSIAKRSKPWIMQSSIVVSIALVIIITFSVFITIARFS